MTNPNEYYESLAIVGQCIAAGLEVSVSKERYLELVRECKNPYLTRYLSPNMYDICFDFDHEDGIISLTFQEIIDLTGNEAKALVFIGRSK